MSAIIDKSYTVVEETHREMVRQSPPPNPGARRDRRSKIHSPEIRSKTLALIAIGEELAKMLSKKALPALGIDGAKAQSTQGRPSAKNGELEHAAAILHPDNGRARRKGAGKASVIYVIEEASGQGTRSTIPSPQGRGVRAPPFRRMRCRSTMRRAPTRSWWGRDHRSGRPLARVGGLTVAEIKGEDGLR